MRKELLPMKTMALALSLLAAGLGSSLALASPGHGHGDTTTASHGKREQSACRPTVSFVLNGTFLAAGTDGSSFSMNVTHSNHHAKLLGASPTVSVDAKTRIVRNGKRSALADLQAGDWLNVRARSFKIVPVGTIPALVAKRVVAHPAADTAESATTDETTPEQATTDETTTEQATTDETTTEQATTETETTETIDH
jgi:hypothetical protein